ncbi:MAG: hypothetical protein H0U65_17225 [Rubrobacter sp.]|jgi:hypothetical protein|nr:hypothetical protein [Rubrobacter sp.]
MTPRRSHQESSRNFSESGELVGLEIYDAASSKLDLSNFVLKRREKDGIDARFDIGTGFLLQNSEEVRSAEWRRDDSAR